MTEANCPILLVEDSPEDTEATMRAFKKAGMKNPVYHCENGDDGLDFVFRRGAFSSPSRAPRPCVILLDLNLPGTDGREVLYEIKKDEDLKSIPIVVLTTSTDQRDIESCYRMGANSYIRKPVDLNGFFHTIQRLNDYWFKEVVLPPD